MIWLKFLVVDEASARAVFVTVVSYTMCYSTVCETFHIKSFMAILVLCAVSHVRTPLSACSVPCNGEVFIAVDLHIF